MMKLNQPAKCCVCGSYISPDSVKFVKRVYVNFTKQFSIYSPQLVGKMLDEGELCLQCAKNGVEYLTNHKLRTEGGSGCDGIKVIV
jgi:hypothetical protein